MNKVRRKFILYAMLAVFALITALLALINGINYSMASDDADQITTMIAEEHGAFAKGGAGANGQDRPDRIGPMGPDSPEINHSVRYFTVCFDEGGKSEVVAYHISALTKEQARELAEKLQNETTGWVRGIYRYRVYQLEGRTYVTVIDQGRELLPAYRILLFSIAGELVSLLICFLFLMIVGRALFRPLEEGDRRQRQFLTEAEAAFKVPLTVVGADAEMIERESGPSAYTASIRRQVKKMAALVTNLGALNLTVSAAPQGAPANLSEILQAALDARRPAFAERGVALTCAIDEGLYAACDSETFRRIAAELAENALKFASGYAAFTLKAEEGRVVLTAENDAALPDESPERIFDRFTRLANAAGKPGSGLGLSYVKDAVRALNGRLRVTIEQGIFKLRITF